MQRLTPAVLVGLCGASSSCGGGAALLHPAHTLAAGEVAAGAGLSGTFVTGEAARALDAPAPEGEPALVEAAMLDASTAPGLAPWVGARVGLGATSEAGLTYSGRALRAGGRHAFESPELALSLGAGVSAVFARGRDDPPFGLGVDVPVLVGYRSQGSLVQAWAGLRGGFESISGSLEPEKLEPLGREEPLRFDANRFYGGGLLGLAVGVRPIRVALELDVSYFQVSAAAGGAPETAVRGWSLTPAGALIGHF